MPVSKYIGRTEIDGRKTICVAIFEDASGIFSGKKPNILFVNLSKITKIESIGERGFGSNTYFADRITLKDGKTIESANIEGSGHLYACEMDENGNFRGDELKWNYFQLKDEKKHADLTMKLRRL